MASSKSTTLTEDELANARARFDAKWQRDAESGCWIWTACLDDRGYGRFRIRSSTIENMKSAHRAGWILHVGDIQDGKWVLHRCNTPACVNPDHLYLGTQSDNMKDAVAAGTHNMASKTHCPQGHKYTAENTGIYKGGRYCRECSRTKALARYHAKRRAELAVS
jgi:hypothetical protein